MNYVGSKQKLKKHLVPIIQKAIDDTGASVYIEPFGGGGNVIDDIHCDTRMYYDDNPYLVALWEHFLETTGDVPDVISREEYQKVKANMGSYPDWYVGLVGFLASYKSGFFNGYAGSWTSKDGKKTRIWFSENKANMMRQLPKMRDVRFECADFRKIDIPDGSVVYCDPPYKGTKTYKGTCEFPYDEYYDWCRDVGKRATLLMSEIWMPDDFEVVWEKDIALTMDHNQRGRKRQERLYTI